MSDPNVLRTTDGRHIAYHEVKAQDTRANTPGVVFLGGFRSDMTGAKAVFVDDWARERGLACLRFDYTGHGASSGDFEDGCIGDWAQDAADAVEAMTEGPQLLVGSSMGGWIALLLARQMPHRVAALVGIAAAPDFTEDSMWASASDAQRRDIRERGRVELHSEYSDDPYVITRKLIEDGRNHLILRKPLEVTFPVRLLHGTADADVPQERALQLLAHIDGPDVRVTFIRGSGHRMSGDAELSVLKETLNALI